MTTYRVSWSVDVDICGDHRAAAQAVADDYFQHRIATGQPDSACHFEVLGPDGLSTHHDLADGLLGRGGEETS